MAAGFEVLGLALSLGTLAVAALIVFLARRSLAAAFLAIYLAGWGATGLANWVLDPLGIDVAARLKTAWAFQWLVAFAIVGFAVVFPNVNVTRGRRIALGIVTAAAVGGIVTIFLLPDRGFYDPETGASALTRVFGTLTGTTSAFAIALLGRRWLASPPGTYRTQIVWGILPIAWWTLHDVLGYSIYPMILDGRLGPRTGNPVLAAAAWVNIAALFFTLALMGVALSRAMRGRGAPDDRALGFVLLYALPVTLVQVVAPDPGGLGPSPWHLLLDYAVVPLAVYGVLRHRVVDIDLKLKRGIRHSTVAGAFLAVFFVVATIAQEFLADTLGWLAGGAAAGVLFLGIAPLQRAAERLSSAAMPHARDDAGYLTYRRYQIYRVALEGTLRDGVTDPAETSALRSLREELGLTMDDHLALEGDARARLGIRPAEPAVAG